MYKLAGFIPNIVFVLIMVIILGLIIFQERHRDYMDKTTNHDPAKLVLHIKQFKNHQDIYLVPIEKWNKYPDSWWRNNYPKEYYVGYYSFSLFYVGQHSPS